ncbi:MAG TPA: pyruvate ferredoxin oxidoreductase, partial [Thermoanaerobaculia bacterium]|nr:pyruvate ferredoxin oxidoreductase [Thermoanaerobaculia bacterium]
DDAETVVVASGTMASAARQAVRRRRERGERVGLLRIKQFRPFPRSEVLSAVGTATRVGVLDRNHSPGSGGIFWNEVATTLRNRPQLLVQDYIAGIGGGDVTPAAIDEMIGDLVSRDAAAEPVWAEVS